MKCLHCQEETKNPKFCCRTCAAIYNNKKSPKRKLTRLCSCLDCKSIVRNYRSSRCETHYQEYLKCKKDSILETTIGEYRDRNKLLHSSSTHAHIRGLARSWFKELTKKPCAACGYNKHVELCHIKAMASFTEDSLIKEVNNKDNIVQLCPNCHWEFDNGLLSRQQGWQDSNLH
jgi:hypothetical protein